MEYTDRKESDDYAFYHEYCLLKILRDMGYLEKEETDGIIQSVMNFYQATINVL